ncbi:unnamed protein product [Caenorhabditis angaria]|uniref:ZP domain-containing protein n=1 Tax=Caenorhabditis angaria TaxID=860376 RepID=A0A9P1IZM8_9PELO|nr:unnamed protein product [Caenorhabditis angaria]
MRILFLFLLLCGLVECLVKPIWKTPVSEPNPTQNIEVTPDKEHANLTKRAQPNYYTRPEQVPVPDYRGARQRLPGPQPIPGSGFFRPFAWVGPQPRPGSPQTTYYNQVPNKSPSFPLPPLPPNWQQYPVQMIWIPDAPGIQSPPNVGSPQRPPVYGQYGPPPATRSPSRPSVNPSSYTGTPVHSPSAQPTEEGYGDTKIPDSYRGVDLMTVKPYGGVEPLKYTGYPTQGPHNPYGSPNVATYGPSSYATQQPQNPYGSPNVATYGPSSIATQRPQNHYGSPNVATHGPSSLSTQGPENTYGTSPNAYESPTYPPSNQPNPYESPSVATYPPQSPEPRPAPGPFPTPSETISPPPASQPKNPTIRPGPQEYATPKSTLPYDADETSEIPDDLTTSKNSPIFEMSTNPFDGSSSKTVPPVYLGPDEETDDISDTTKNSSPPPTTSSSSSEDEDMLKAFYPRPANEQGYQPPGHQPDTHINVNFKKPKGCTGEICHGVDTDKISLYKPDRNDEGSGPTLVISNAAKDDASRAGYRPAQPPVVNPYIPPNPQPINPDDYNTPYTNPPYHPFPELREYTPSKNVPEYTTQQTTVFPSSKIFEEESTTAEPFSPTAQTVPYTTTPAPPPENPPPKPPAKYDEGEDHPEYVPPAIAHMTPSTPAGKNPPTFIPLHPETSTNNPTERNSVETQTPATVTRKIPEFPVKPSPGTAPPQILTTPIVSTDVVTEAYTASTEIVTEAPTTSEAYTTPEVTEAPTTSAPEFTEVSIDRETTASDVLSTTTTVPSTDSGYVTSTISLSTTTSRPIPTSRSEWVYSTDQQPSSSPSPPRINNPYAPPEGAPRVPNRVIGKPRILCKEDGISFEVKTILPFTGEIFANDRKRIEECQQSYTDEPSPKIFLPFDKCGVKNIGDQINSRAQYHMQVVLIVDQGNGTNTLQSFMAQCVHQKVNYNKQILPKRIEEALEELKLIPAKLEQKASMPSVQMQIVVDEGHHKLGQEVMAADIGMPLALKWSLVPESDAYGMHVRNCKVVDAVGKIDHTLIDEQGCSADLQIIDHPHYDTYHDTASAHMWAFKVPDMASLQIKCDILICSNIKSSVSNTTSCEDIPSPPFCADVVTSPPNSILSDASSYVKPRRSYSAQTSTQSVRTSICLSQNCKPAQNVDDLRVCINTQLATISTGFSLAFLISPPEKLLELASSWQQKGKRSFSGGLLKLEEMILKVDT